MTYGAFGLVEVLGEANAVLVLDKMLKTAEVSYETQEYEMWRTCSGICERKCISGYSSCREY